MGIIKFLRNHVLLQIVKKAEVWLKVDLGAVTLVRLEVNLGVATCDTQLLQVGKHGCKDATKGVT